MRFRLYGIALGVFFALGLVFSFGVESSAQTKRADDVTDQKDETQIREFLSYVVAAFDDINDDANLSEDEKNRRLIILGREFRQNDGEYRKDDLYTLGINAGSSVTNHPGYPQLFAYDFDKTSSSTVTDTLNKLIEDSGVGVESMVCEEYGQGQDARFACAVKVSSPSGTVTVVAGLHHTIENSPFSLPEICEGITLNTKAEDVVNEASLTSYVKDVITESKKLILGVASRITVDPTSAEGQMQFAQGLYGIAACFGQGDMKHENIYSFIMDTNQKNTVFLNGNNFDLNGLDLDVTDSDLPVDDQKVSTLFRNALTCGSDRNLQAGDYATVYYRWDNPSTTADNNSDFLTNGMVPGTSDKTGYIEVANLFEDLPGSPARLYIFGSGIYPSGGNPDDIPDTHYVCAEAETKTDDDDGCAIAGTGHTPQGALLNLLLTASVLFSVVFLRRRA